MKKYYVDSCIWLNLFKREGDASKGIPYWKITKLFLRRIRSCKDAQAVYTAVVLKEIERVIDNPEVFKERLRFIKEEKKFMYVECLKEDYDVARKLESESGFRISFTDCINIAVCKRLGAVLVTRDNLLIEFARKYIKVDKPEHLTV